MAQGPTLLVLSPSTGGYYFGALLAGVAREAAAVDGRIVLVQTLELGLRSDEIGEAPAFDVPVDWDQVDGVVSITSAVRAEYLRRFQAGGKPAVLASNMLPGLEIPTAQPDNRGGTVAAVEHLIAHGHTRIGFVGNLAQADIAARHQAYRDTLTAHGLVPDPAHLFRAADNAESGGVGAAAALLAAPDRPTALMVATDRNAVGVLDTLAAAGLLVPADMAMVGFDNIENAVYTSPSLTTVDQSFEAVGALATRLVLAQLSGTAVPCVPHTSPAAVITRGSCGCSTEPGDRPVDRVTDLPAGTDASGAVVAETVERLRRPFSPPRGQRTHPLWTALDAVLTEVTRLAAPDADAAPADVDALVARLRRLAPRPETLRQLIRALTAYLRRLSPSPAGTRLLDALAVVQAGSFLSQTAFFETSLEEQYAVDSGLLDPNGSDPRDLTWLGGTHVRAGALALWADEPSGPDAPDRPAGDRLRIAGVYDPDGSTGVHVGMTLSSTQFPPVGLSDTADPGDRRLTVVVPVRTREHEWGLLAVVGQIETASARETYHHWAALLASALEERALQQAVRTSEERYALASRAANDGLWELGVHDEHVYVSERCRDLLALPGEGLVAVAEWEDRIHPDDTTAVRQAMLTAMSLRGEPVEVEYRVRRPGGEYTWVLSRCLGVADGSGPVTRLVGSLSDIDQRKQLEEQLRRGALYDAVTGLPNRRLFLDRLGVAVARPSRRDGTRFAVIFLDLDGFKLVNDSLGHLLGDELLRTVAARLRGELRAVDTAARFGGDEFAVLLSDPIPDEVLVIARRIQERISAPVLLAGHEVSVTASVGITTSESHYTDAEDVLRDADIAMYDAKATERGSASVFDPAMHALATGRLKARSELRTALAERQFVVHYQPIVALDGSGVAHFEALVRWQHPQNGLLLPGAFLPAMEDNSTIVALGRWLIDEVCRQIAEWRTAYDGPVAVSVNVSHREFWADGLKDTVAEALERHGVPAQCVVAEITESVIMADLPAARRIMTGLHQLGVRLHIDDFGTGQSSLNALRTLPVDALKIDGSFIREITDVQRTTDLVGIIVHMGKVLGLDVIAECVETREQADQLTTMGCRNAQGWLYAAAVPGATAGSLLGNGLGAVPESTGGAAAPAGAPVIGRIG